MKLLGAIPLLIAASASPALAAGLPQPPASPSTVLPTSSPLPTAGASPSAGSAASATSTASIASGAANLLVPDLGTLSITAPSAATLLSTGANTVTGSLGAVTITDTRTTAGSWTLSIRAQSLTLRGATSLPAHAVIAPSSIRVWTANSLAPQVPGTATISAPHPSANPLTLSTSDQVLVTAATAASVTGNIAIITPSISVDTTGKARGAYTGVVTQSVS